MEIDQLLLDKLSDVLTYDQKIRKIGKLLTSLRERNRIEIGEKNSLEGRDFETKTEINLLV